MDDLELKALFEDIESDRVERKDSIKNHKKKVREAICAFANDLPGNNKPGVIFIGVNDDRSCANFPITDELLRTLSDMKTDGNIIPIPSLSVEKKTINGCEFAVIIAQPSDSPPIRYKGRVYIRVGPRRAVATAEEERRLTEKRRYKDIPFDLHPIESSNISDLDLDLFKTNYLPLAVSPDILEKNSRSVEEKLASLRFLSNEGKPTVLGLLTIGKDPQNFIPGAYIQFVRFAGKELTDPVKDRKEISGPLREMLSELEDVLKSHINVATEMSETIELKRPDFPLIALREIIRNAVLHRTYEITNAPVKVYWFEDRIEIHSPGGPYGQVTKGNFGKESITDYRNPHLAEAMRVLGYVQRFGIGIPTAKKELKKNGNPDLDFKVEDTCVAAVIKRAG